MRYRTLPLAVLAATLALTSQAAPNHWWAFIILTFAERIAAMNQRQSGQVNFPPLLENCGWTLAATA